MSFEYGSCRFSMTDIPLPEPDKFEGYIAYGLTQKDSPWLRNVDKPLTQTCGLEIKAADVDKILQPEEVTTRYFRMIADYTYIVEEKYKISVDQMEGLNAKLVTSLDKPIDSGSDVKCEIRDDKEIRSDVTFRLFENDNKVTEISKYCPEKMCQNIFTNTFPEETRLKCEAVVENRQDMNTATAYTTVKNSPPYISDTRIYLDEATNKIICSADVQDRDNDEVVIKFEVSGFAPTEKKCPGTCSVEIPAEGDLPSKMSCSVTAYDDEDSSSGSASMIIGAT